jgi:hypothetical protein
MMTITNNTIANQIPTTTTTTTTKTKTKAKVFKLPWSIANEKHDDNDEQYDCSPRFFLFVFCVCVVGAS